VGEMEEEGRVWSCKVVRGRERRVKGQRDRLGEGDEGG
jgi:hypothetical protein